MPGGRRGNLRLRFGLVWVGNLRLRFRLVLGITSHFRAGGRRLHEPEAQAKGFHPLPPSPRGRHDARRARCDPDGRPPGVSPDLDHVWDWLPGDERSWADKLGTVHAADAELEWAARSRMTEPALTLDDEQRRTVERTIAEHCRFRAWHLHAVNCRTNHVHVVVAAGDRRPKDVMDQFKAWCTRRLKERERPEGRPVRANWWTQRGSARWLNDEPSVDAAVRYVLEGQDRMGGDTRA